MTFFDASKRWYCAHAVFLEFLKCLKTFLFRALFKKKVQTSSNLKKMNLIIKLIKKNELE